MSETNALHLLADTNLFFEFKKLEDLPWQDLGVDPIIILVAKPVLDEIDKHKKANGRTRDRAMNIFRMLRDSFKSGGADTVIKEKSPRVLLRHIGSVAPDEALVGRLDLQKNDDRLIAILSALVNQDGYSNVVLFTDDTGPVSTAQGLGLPFLFIEDEWRRPPEQTTETKRIKALEKDLEAYRSQEPDIQVRHGEAIENGSVKIVRRVAQPLKASEIDTLVEKLKSKYPIQADFSPPPKKVFTNPLNGAQTEYSYEGPSQDEIDQYRNVDYPQWLERCSATFRKLHEYLSQPEEKAIVSWGIENAGTRPAKHARIEFKAEGEIAIMRVGEKVDDDEEASSDTSSQAAQLNLPSPPSAPNFKEIKKEISPPKTAAATGRDLAKLVSAAAGIAPNASALIRASEESLTAGRLLQDFYDSPIQRMLRDQEQFSNLLNPPIHDIRPLSIDFEALRPPPAHEPEAFYYDDWKPHVPVKMGALTCDLWRHKKASSTFEYEVAFVGDDEAKGAVLCTVHAENLTKPVSLRIPVSRTVEAFSIFEDALTLIDDI